jgi:integrase
VRPVPDHVLDATLPHLSPTVRAMVELQLGTGMRPGEVCQMRTCDIDTTGKVWSYTPAKHKTQHHGHTRTVRIGPKAQQVLRPFLRLDTQAYVFSPAEADTEWRRAKREARKTKVPPSQVLRSARAQDRDRQRPPGDRYDVNGYRRAIARACDAAFPPPRSPVTAKAAHRPAGVEAGVASAAHGC